MRLAEITKRIQHPEDIRRRNCGFTRYAPGGHTSQALETVRKAVEENHIGMTRCADPLCEDWFPTNGDTLCPSCRELFFKTMED